VVAIGHIANCSRKRRILSVLMLFNKWKGKRRGVLFDLYWNVDSTGEKIAYIGPDVNRYKHVTILIVSNFQIKELNLKKEEIIVGLGNED
jgi:hypothetical protein